MWSSSTTTKRSLRKKRRQRSSCGKIVMCSMSGFVKIWNGQVEVSELCVIRTSARQRGGWAHNIGVVANVVSVVPRRVAIKRRNLDSLQALDASNELAKRTLLVLSECLGWEDVERGRVGILLKRLCDGELVDERLARRRRGRDDDVLPARVLGRRVERVDGGRLVRVEAVWADVL